MALGVLSCDGLSSAAYGTEEILYGLPIGTHSGLIAFGAVYILARSFANGGSSQSIAKRQGAGFRLSGLEAAGREVADVPQG